MTTVAQISAWIPEDDLLLKNAVEAGASLEALAKGAVQFSRRFTFRELRDRWHSLLYDPDVSAQASARMVELELSGTSPLSKLNRLDSSRETKDVPEKRKIGSIRRQYYAMRKRIRSEFFNSADLDILAEPNLHDCGGNEGDFQDHVKLDNEPLVGTCMVGDCNSNHFELQETDFDILSHAFPQTMTDITNAQTLTDIADANDVADAGNAFHDEHVYSLARNDSLFGFSGDVSLLSAKESQRIDERESFQQKNNALEDHLGDIEKSSDVDEITPLQGLPDSKLFKTDDTGRKPLSPFTSTNDNLQNVCSRFGGQQFNSPGSDDGDSFPAMRFSSPLPRLHLWKAMEDISTPAMPVNMNLGDKSQVAEEISNLPDNNDDNKKSSADYGAVYSQPTLKDRHEGDRCINSTNISEGEFADISDSLLNFPNEDEILFMNVDGKDTMDKSCYDNLNSLLLNSPHDGRDDSEPNVELKALTVSKTCLANPGTGCPAESEVISSSLTSIHCDQRSGHSEFNVASMSSLSAKSHEPNDRNICCTLNTEDPEIPCNDDIFLLIHPASTATCATTSSVDTIDLDLATSSVIEKDRKHGINLTKKGDVSVTSFTSSKMVALNILPETNPGHIVVGRNVKAELADAKCLAMVPVNANRAPRDGSQCLSAHATPFPAINGTPEEDAMKAELMMINTPATLRGVQLHADAEVTLPESVVNPAESDQEEYESETDVPYFSDIEAMILEMDLGPYDQDSYLNRQVSRYQCDDSRRKIIRLEQCAHSSLQRAMGSQGAFAILYGRQLKHYIRKTEVILGRSTNDIKVDIDLGKEGHANKISRRQAIIKMEGDGSFVLKNLGKCSISVNGKEVATGQLLTLTSSCLIEVRGMSFVFETNHKSVKRYLDSLTKKSDGSTHFQWTPEG